MTSPADATPAPLPYPQLAARLEQVLKLRALPIGMKLLARADDLKRVPRVRRPQAVHTLDQLVGQAARLGWTVGLTADDLVGDQCRSVVGLGGQDEAWRSGKAMAGVWYATEEDSARHQAAMHCMPRGAHAAMVIAPLAKWGQAEAASAQEAGQAAEAHGAAPMDAPDIALFYATPGAMIYFINGLQWRGYKRFDWSVVGESSCADSWGRALATREPSLSIPCFAERRYGGVEDDEMLMALTPADIAKALQGMEALAKNGLRYPFASYGLQQDVRAGMAVSYPGRAA